ncbi:MAG: fumarylacetoacetate hydrolase family protein [Bosea sp.]|uniref:fumarylacetoacetate hydrolase family protein n=1 Tax=Bosea sp. (in: a-proteobacteria) TaxID=1871050 RepID=UPI0023942FE5|nr:fumarylacetoacetate hydrolase family protein [Bosea sp. (in: a-proteobacteria)]MCP4736522.1 fumarylacetoacetate hydrolase family protein [Bosea sp. (in: a-proteobacteria)]
MLNTTIEPAARPETRQASARWVRFAFAGRERFGTLIGGTIALHSGDMFAGARPTGERVPLDDVTLLAPSTPSKIIALWNNFHALAAKLSNPVPAEPLYLMKAPSSAAKPGATIARPPSYAGKVVYEGELGIVIGRRCSEVTPQEAGEFIFGYTCVNDITALDLIAADPTFAQWVRAKSFDGFGPFGPVIATGLDPRGLTVRTLLNGQERQNYPVADMIFRPQELVSRLSHDMTLLPGDLICCGTSLGVGTMKEPVNTIEVAIEGIGTLANTFVQGG